MRESGAMSRQISPATQALHHTLADHQAHTLDELVDIAGPLIPEERAWRQAEGSRLAASGPPTRYQGDRAQAVAAGRRDIIRRRLSELTRHHRITRNPDGTYQKKGEA